MNKEGRVTSPAPLLSLAAYPAQSQPAQPRPGKAERPSPACQSGREGLRPGPALQPRGAGRSSWQSGERCAESRRAQPPWRGAGGGKDRPLQLQTFHRKGALSVRTGSKRQAYLCHKADRLRFAQKTDGTALVEGDQEALRLRGSHGPHA